MDDDRIDKIEAFLIAQQELNQLGHRIVYDGNGISINVGGCMVDPSKLDKYGHQVKL